ncbi:MAG: division/cell wall cluster transcriptional repressor MraZ [Chitinophagales bacterium]|nr:division/cell wall cluster transcriptional repressor MraZ [Chitinophagales bacterium]
MATYTGQYQVKVDNKGRLRLPSDLLKQLEDQNKKFVINKGLEKCLRLYPINQWNAITEEMNKLSYFKTKEREFLRFFYQMATQTETDSNDRILIPKRLMEKTNITNEVVILAFHDVIEIWDSNTYYDTIQEPDDFSDMADEIWSKLKND